VGAVGAAAAGLVVTGTDTVDTPPVAPPMACMILPRPSCWAVLKLKALAKASPAAAFPAAVAKGFAVSTEVETGPLPPEALGNGGGTKPLGVATGTGTWVWLVGEIWAATGAPPPGPTGVMVKGEPLAWIAGP